MKRYWWMILAVAGSSSCLPAAAHAGQVLAIENFGDYQSGSKLGNQAGGMGFAGNWSARDYVTVAPPSPAFGAGNHLVIAPTGSAGQDSIASRTFAAISGSVYVTLDLRLINFFEAVGSSGQDFIQFQVSNGSVGNSADSLSFGVRATASAFQFFARSGKASSDTDFVGPATNGTSYSLGALFSKSAGSTYDRIDLFLNPTGSPLLMTPDATSIFDTGLTQLTKFNIRGSGLEPGDVIHLDNLRIQAVPEPSTLAMGLTGALIVAGRRFRRRTGRA